MEIPVGKIDIKNEALKLYESAECDRLFSEARERFPQYQGSQLFDALDHVLDGLAALFEDRYQGDWLAISDQLSDHIHNGLT